MTIDDFTAVIAINPNDAEAFYCRGNLYLEIHEYEKAIEDYTSAIAIDPDCTAAFFNRGFTYTLVREYVKAIDDFTAAIAINPNDVEVFCCRGIVYYELKKYEKAIDDFTAVIAINPNDVEAFYCRGNLYLEIHEYEKAIEDFTTVIAIDPSNAGAFFNRGNAYCEIKEYKKVIEDFTTVIAIDPSNAGVFFNQSNTYYRIKEYEKAIEDFTTAITIDPNNADAFINRGVAYSRIKEYKKAIEDYTSAIAIDPDRTAAFFNRGFTYTLVREYVKAIDDFTTAIAIKPNDERAFYNRGFVYLEIKEYEKATEDFTTAIAICPNNAYAFFNRGNTYYRIKEYEKAIEDYTTGIAIDPNNADAFNNRGNTYYRIKEYEQAIEDFTTSIAIDPNNADAFNNRGAAYRRIKKFEQAIEDCTTAIRINPEYAKAFYNRGVAYCKIEEYEQAIEDYTTAIRINPECAEAFINRGNTYYRIKEYEQAIEDFETAIQRGTELALPWYYLGRIYFIKNDVQKANKHFLRSLYLQLPDGDTIISCLSKISETFFCPLLIAEYYNVPLRFAHTGEPLRLSDEIILQAEKMRQFILTISEQQPAEKTNIRTQAIIYYHMGNPINAFKIFDEEWDDGSAETKYDMLGQYYFYKCAQLFFQEDDAILNNALEAMNEKIENKEAEYLDYYYAALLCMEKKDYDCALAYLYAAQKDNRIILPILYAQLFCYYEKHDHDKQEELCKAICKTETNLLLSHSGYFVELHISKISFDLNKYMSQLSHYCHYVESSNSFTILKDYIEQSDKYSFIDLKALMKDGRETLGQLWDFTDEFNTILAKKENERREKFIHALEEELKPDDSRAWKIDPEWENLSPIDLAEQIGSSFDKKYKEKDAFFFYRNIVLYYGCRDKLETGDIILLLFYCSIKEKITYIQRRKIVSINLFVGVFVDFVIRYGFSMLNESSSNIIENILKPSISSPVVAIISYFFTSLAISKNDFNNMSYQTYSKCFFEYLYKANKRDNDIFKKLYKDIDKVFKKYSS